MAPLKILIGSLFALLAFGLSTDSESFNTSPVSTTPRLVKIFQSTVNLGQFSEPIPIQGGQRIVATVLNGTIKGQISGTVRTGISVIDLFDNGQTIVNTIRCIATTSDGLPVLIDEVGTGSAGDNFARISLSVGGRYASLSRQFLLVEAALAPDRKSASTAGYELLDR